MNDTTAIPLIVHSAVRDPVETLNSLLRRGGLAVHCTWIPAVQDVADALEQINPELLISAPASDEELRRLVAVRDAVAPMVPLLLLRDAISEAGIGEDMAHGARDSISLQESDRLQRVIARELRSFRLERTLTNTLRASQDYRKQLEVVLQRSNDAIAQIQEGILVDANAAWLELFGASHSSSPVGQPVMDLFDEPTQAALKAALTACLQGRWSNLPIKAGAWLGGESAVPLELLLALGEFEGEPSVRLIVPAPRRDERALARDLESAVHNDPGTGLLLRRHLIAALQERLAQPVAGGVRFLVCVRPDKFRSIERDVGVLASEQFLVGLAGIVRSVVGPHDLAGHFGGPSLLLLLERGSAREVEAWCEGLLERVRRNVFLIDSHSLRATCTIGLSAVPLARPDLNAAAMDVLDAVRRGRERAGNQMVAVDRTDEDTRVRAYDEIWVRHIKSALMENRFRLVQQPIAALAGGERKLFDVAVRMIDAQGKEVLPAEFMPAAARNDLLKNIDRWVIGASLSFIANRKPELLFVRLSQDSAFDPGLLPWLELQLKSTRADTRRLCLQLTEELAGKYLQQTQQLAADLKARGLPLALEHFGVGRDPLGLLATLPLDYVKIDGSLMQGLASSKELQEHVRSLVHAAARSNVETIAEHIEDANTMAVVWQLGVQYIQGYLVRAPEEVVLKS